MALEFNHPGFAQISLIGDEVVLLPHRSGHVHRERGERIFCGHGQAQDPVQIRRPGRRWEYRFGKCSVVRFGCEFARVTSFRYSCVF